MNAQALAGQPGTGRSDESSPKVLWWLPEYPPNPGGIATFAQAVGCELRDRGASPTMLVGWGGPTVEEVDRLRVIREPIRRAIENGRPSEIIGARRRIAAIKNEVEPDLYHVHLTDPSAVLHLSTANSAPAPLVLTLHNAMYEKFPVTDPDSFMSRLSNAASIIVNCSVGAHRTNIAAASQFAHRMVVVPNGIESPPTPLPLPPTPTVLAIGRLQDQKRFDRLIRALPELRCLVPGVRVTIAGDGPKRPELEALIDELGVGDIVDLPGHIERSEMIEAFRAARVVVAPSQYEGLPYALLEAAAFGRPIVASNTGGIDDVVVDGLNGRLLAHDVLDQRPAEFAAAIAESLLLDGPAQEFAEAGRERIAQHLSIGACTDRYQQIYALAVRPAVDVSIIIPAWNAERHLAATLDSVLADIDGAVSAQTDGRPVSVQIMVIDDGSTDATAGVAAAYAGRGVEMYRQPNLGGGHARNAGLALTRSTLVAHFDADDLWPEGRLEALLEPFGDLDQLAADVGRAVPDAVFGLATEFADADAPANKVVSTEHVAVRMLSAGLIRRDAHDRFGAFKTNDHNDQLQWGTFAIASGLRTTSVPVLALRRRIHATNTSHSAVFTTSTSRVAVIKAALDEQRRRAASAGSVEVQDLNDQLTERC